MNYAEKGENKKMGKLQRHIDAVLYKQAYVITFLILFLFQPTFM